VHNIESKIDEITDSIILGKLKVKIPTKDSFLGKLRRKFCQYQIK
jgi:hypothetical protein